MTTTHTINLSTLRLNAIAGMAHVQVRDGLRVTILPTNVRPNNAGPYYFLVTQRSTSLTAFRTRQGFMRWMIERGLHVPEIETIADGRDAAVSLPIVGSYIDAMWGTEREQFEQLRGYRTAKLDNASFTNAVITHDDDGRHVVNFMNVNSDRATLAYAPTYHQLDSRDTLTISDMTVTREIVAGLMPDVDGWHLSREMSGAWLWTKEGVDVDVFASLWWEDQPSVPLQLSADNGDTYLHIDTELLDDELDAIDDELLRGSMQLDYTPNAPVAAVRYLRAIVPVLQYVEKHAALLVSKQVDRNDAQRENKITNEVIDAQLARVVMQHVAENEREIERDVEIMNGRKMHVLGVSSFRDAGVLTLDHGFVIDALIDGTRRQVHVTMQVQ